MWLSPPGLRIFADAYCVADSKASIGGQRRTIALKLESLDYDDECVRPSVGCFEEPDGKRMLEKEVQVDVREGSFKMSQYMADACRVREHSLVMNGVQANPRCVGFFEILLG